jgi:predicted nucleic acid-binding protein
MWTQKLPPWIRVQAPTTVDASLNVDDGEKEAICLAREVKAVAILMDDRKGRAEAIRCGLRVAGTIGLLEAAGRRGLLDFAAAIQRLRQTNAPLDEGVIQNALTRMRRV